MSFKTDLSNIRNAKAGKIVKEAIASALENAYAESVAKGNTDAEVIQARGDKSTLNARITKIETLMGVLENINIDDTSSFASAINEIVSNINRDEIFPWLRWIKCANMPSAIEMFGIGLIADDYIYLWQGVTDSTNNNNVYRYQISKNTWTNITNGGSFSAITSSVVQSSSISIEYNNQKFVLSIGGLDKTTNKDKAEIVKVTADKAEVVAYLNYARRNVSSCYYNGKVYMIGGYTIDHYSKAIEVLNLSTMQVDILSPLPIVPQGYVTSAIKSGKIYIFESSIDSNNNNYIYDVSTRESTTFPKHAKQNDQMRAVTFGDYIILMGGYNNAILWWDITNSKWIDMTKGNAYVKAWATPILDKYDHLYLFGGATKDSEGVRTVHDSVDCYLPIRDLEEIEESE